MTSTRVWSIRTMNRLALQVVVSAVLAPVVVACSSADTGEPSRSAGESLAAECSDAPPTVMEEGSSLPDQTCFDVACPASPPESDAGSEVTAATFSSSLHIESQAQINACKQQYDDDVAHCPGSAACWGAGGAAAAGLALWCFPPAGATATMVTICVGGSGVISGGTAAADCLRGASLRYKQCLAKATDPDPPGPCQNEAWSCQKQGCTPKEYCGIDCACHVANEVTTMLASCCMREGSGVCAKTGPGGGPGGPNNTAECYASSLQASCESGGGEWVACPREAGPAAP